MGELMHTSSSTSSSSSSSSPPRLYGGFASAIVSVPLLFLYFLTCYPLHNILVQLPGPALIIAELWERNVVGSLVRDAFLIISADVSGLTLQAPVPWWFAGCCSLHGSCRSTAKCCSWVLLAGTVSAKVTILRSGGELNEVGVKILF